MKARALLRSSDAVPSPRPTDPSTIVVVRLSSVGDVLLTTPLLRALRRSYPDARLRFVVKAAYADLVRLNPHVDEVCTWPEQPARGRPLAAGVLSSSVRRMARGIRSDTAGPLCVVDLQASPRTLAFTGLLRPSRRFVYRKDYLRRLLLVAAKIDRYPDSPPSVAERYFNSVHALGLEPDGEGLDLVLGPEAEARARSLLETAEREDGGLAAGVGWIAVAPGSRWATKRWPPESFAAAARAVAGDLGLRVVVVGSAQDAEAGRIIAGLLATAGVRAVDLTGSVSLVESAAVIARSVLLLTNDSGPAHLASAVRVPALVLFGSTVPQFGFAPYRSPAGIVGVEGLPCRPCTHIGRTACPLGHFKCMREISPGAVAAEVLKLLRDARADHGRRSAAESALGSTALAAHAERRRQLEAPASSESRSRQSESMP